LAPHSERNPFVTLRKLYPAIAILIVGVIDSQLLSRNRWLERGTMWWFILVAAAGIGLIVLPVTIGQRLGLPSGRLSRRRPY
jgi:hypothetical protein